MERLAKLPADQQNVVIFDAAMRLLKSNYHDYELFEKPEWSAYEAGWRKKASESQSGGWLYANVLSNLGTSFPDSRLYFVSPARPPPTVATSAPREAQSPADPAILARTQQIAALSSSGPGFDIVPIRRGHRTLNLVGDVVRGSPAERAGISPGWKVGDWGYVSNLRGVHFKATFIALAPAEARDLERTGLPLNTESQQELDEFVAAHKTELKFDNELLAARTNFETRTFANGVTYLRFDHFNEWSNISRILDVIDAAGPAGLVIDLRRNTGGRTFYMRRVIGRLLGGGVTLGTLRANGSTEPLRSWKIGSGHYEGPLVLLIGPLSTSAAELTAAAVQDHKRGKLVGRMTNGSVVTGQMYDLPDGGKMMIPTRDFVRLDSRRIEGSGVEPDIWILPTLEDVRAGRDPVLERALEKLKK
ncbi:MAG: S41 family peptidase [Pseudomonadota bacterium]